MNQELTQHALARLGQRAISHEDIDLIMLIGTEVEGGYFVRNKDRQTMERNLTELLERIRRLDGKRVVLADGKIITAYRASPAKERRLLRSARQRALADS